MKILIISFIIVISASWVYFDAEENKIGKIKGSDGIFNISAAAWYVATLLLWVIFFPAYLIKRGSLIEKAKEYPFEANGRTGKFVVSGVSGGILSLLLSSGFIDGNVPACDAPEVVDIATQSVKDSPVIKMLGLEVKGLSMPAEFNYDSNTKKRLCRAQLSYALGKEMIEYSVEWHDKAKGLIYVQVGRINN